jgi:hypothetical protein
MRNFSSNVDEQIDKRIAVLAKKQRGWVRRDQLLRLGAKRSWIYRRVEKNLLIPHYNGVYAVGHLPLMPMDFASGAVLACGPEAALSHLSAATLWGLEETMVHAVSRHCRVESRARWSHLPPLQGPGSP